MNDSITVPLRTHNNEKWGALDCWKNRQIDVVAEKFKKVDENYSFIGGHRVRLFRFWDNIHFKLPPIQLDITNVPPAQAPATRPVTVSQHGKRNRNR